MLLSALKAQNVLMKTIPARQQELPATVRL